MEPLSLFSQLGSCIDERLSNSEVSGEEIKEVYARFGAAYYYADSLHRGLCLLYCASQLSQALPASRLRVEEHLRVAFATTLGQLLPKMQSTLPPKLFSKLQKATDRRNFIAHHFWFDRVHLMLTRDGVNSMLEELDEAATSFSALDDEITKLREPLNSRLGDTPESLSLALNDIISGNDTLPLHQQRPLKREETIVAVYNIPVEAGRSVLTFHTDDGALWQLCDIGLGWCSYNEPDLSWPPLEALAGLLPARVNPRPTTVKPWHFDLHFDSKATLSVSLGELPGDIRYKLRLHAPLNLPSA